jgi:hypothetical protein
MLFIKENKENIGLLNKIYSPELIEKALLFIDDKNILNCFNFSSCFDCDECKNHSSCSFFDVIKIAKEVEIAFTGNIPDQTKILHYINN